MFVIFGGPGRVALRRQPEGWPSEVELGPLLRRTIRGWDVGFGLVSSRLVSTRAPRSNNRLIPGRAVGLPLIFLLVAVCGGCFLFTLCAVVVSFQVFLSGLV